MPIVDLEIVTSSGSPPAAAAKALADALGQVFGSAPGRTWVKVHVLDAACYAENDATVAEGELPVFLTVLHARPPEGAARVQEVLAVTRAVAAWAGRAPARVHVRYAPAAAGCQAFGGQLVG
jgi:phenylpyruvate tautomerase PptA (4-oxalocrotonate tautomerase family)